MIIIGYSGHGYVVCGILNSMGKKVTAYCDAAEKQINPFGIKYLGTEADAIEQLKQNEFFISVGDNLIREKIFNLLAQKNLSPISAIHSTAVVDGTAQIHAHGVMIAANATINPLAKIGKGVICNTNCSIDHECIVNDFAHIAPGAVLCGNVTIGSSTFVGANAVIKQGITIGKNVMIGAGSVVVNDIPDNATVMGVPAK